MCNFTAAKLYILCMDGLEPFYATKQANTFEEAVSECVDSLKIQIEKYKNA